MSKFFEELMAQNRQLSEGIVVNRSSKKKSVTESKKIRANKIKVESLRMLEDADIDELDAQFAVDPEESAEDEVVLVIDPELPSDEEVPEDAAEEMIGDAVYKCPVCGGNYVCDCDAEMHENLEVDEEGVPVECPICGDDAEQILIGEIAPVEEAGEEVSEMQPVDSDEVADEESEIVEESLDPETIDELTTETDLTAEEIAEVDGIVDEVPAEVVEDNLPLELNVPTEEAEDDEDAIVGIDADTVNIELSLDEVKFESMMNQMIKENYKNAPNFKITKLSATGSRLKIEYVIRRGTKSSKGTMVAEGFSFKDRKLSLKARDKGAFTESFTKTPAFIIECVRIRNKIIPTSIRYNFVKRVNESLYRVKGDVNSANFTKAARRK